MNALTRTVRGLIGLFIDDAKLGSTVIGVLILVALLTHFGAVGGSLAMALLVAGTISALLVNVLRAASRDLSAPTRPGSAKRSILEFPSKTQSCDSVPDLTKNTTASRASSVRSPSRRR